MLRFGDWLVGLIVSGTDAAGGPPRGGGSSRRARWLLALGTTLLLLVPLELAARWSYARRNARLWSVDTSQPPRDMRKDHLRLVDIIRTAPWRDLVFELRPGMEGTFIDKSYHANAQGMRDRELTEAKPPGEFRIALLGDSFSFGWGCDVEDSYANLLESRLADAIPGQRVEVLNFGVPGYNTAMEAACLEHKALAFHPDLLLVQYFFNDLYMPNFLLREPEPPTLYAWDWLQRRLRGAGSEAAPRLQDLGADKDFAATAFADWRRDPAQVPEEYAWMVGPPGVERALRRIGAAANAAHIPVALLIVTTPTQRMLERPPGTAHETDDDSPAISVGHELGFLVIPTLEANLDHLRQAHLAVSDVVLSATDWHPNPAGHRFYANLIAEALRSSRLLQSR